MSVISYLARKTPVIKAEVKSALEEALGKMPDQAMTPEELRNALKNRQVQNLEIEQSGVNTILEDPRPYSVYDDDKLMPSHVLDVVKKTRADYYSVYEYKGMPVSSAISEEDAQLFSQFLRREGYEADDTMLDLNSLERYIKRQEEYKTQLLADREAEDFDVFNYQINQVDNALSEANDMRYRLLGIEDAGTPGNQLRDAWDELTEDMGYGELGYLRVDNIDEYIRRVKEDLQDVDIEGYGDAENVAITRAAYEDRISQAEDIKQRLLRLEDDARLGSSTQYTRDLRAEFENIINEEVPEADFTINELDRYIEKRENDIENLYRESDRWSASEFADFKADFESEINQLRGIRRRLSYANRNENPINILDEFEFEDYELTEVYANLDDYVETVHRIDSREKAIEFKERMEAARPTQQSYDLTLPTQEIIDSTQNEFNALAARHGLEAPDVNDTEETKQFLRIVVNMDNDPQTIQQYMQSYEELASVIERGDETVTIPNWNVRDPNSRYEFAREHYRDYALPDTNDASYSVRIYKNPTVDRKGYDYGTHWSNPDAIKDAVFHVRGDSPQPGVYRIQEIQSDIQNEMTSDRIAAIEQWKRGNDVSFPTVDSIIDNPTMNPEVEKLVAEVNKEFLDDIHSYTKLPDEFDDIMNVAEFPRTRDLAEQHELARYFVELATNGRYTLDMPDGPAKTALTKVIDGWDIHNTEDLAAIRAAIREYNPDMTVRDVENTTQIFRTFHESYMDGLREARDAVERKMRLDTALRVTPAERRQRIIEDSGDMTSEEAKFRENVLNDVEIDFEEAHGIFVPFNIIDMGHQRVKKQIMIGYAMRNGYDTLEQFARDAADKLMDKYPDLDIGDTRKRIANIIMNGSGDPASFKEFFPDFPDAGELAEEVIKNFHKKIDEGMKELTPLEKFPDAKNFDLPIPFTKQGLQEEVVRAINNGQEEVWLTVDPPGVDKLMRGRRPQKNYETGGITNKQFRAIAKRFGAEIVEEDGYLKMKLPVKTLAAGGGIVSVSAYAETDNQDFIENARKAGATDEEILAYMQENPITEEEPSLFEEQALRAGATPEEIKRYEQEQFINEMDPANFAEHPGMPTDVPSVEGGLTYNKLPFETIKEIAIDIEADPSTPAGMDAIYAEARYRENPEARRYDKLQADKYIVEAARDEMADLIEIADFDQPWRWMVSKFGEGPTQEIYLRKKQEIASHVIEMGKERGYDLVLGQGQEVGNRQLEMDRWYINLDGDYYEADPSFIASMARYTGEAVGGMVGFEATRQLLGSANAIPGGRVVKYGLLTAGAVAGAVLGDQIDYATAAMRQHEEYNWAVAKEKAMGAAQAAAAGEVLGAGIFKLGAASWRGLVRTYNMIVDGNVDGAYQFLTQMLDLTDDEARELVQKWETINGMEAPTMAANKPWYDPRKYVADTEKEKAIAVLSTSRAGGESIVAEATRLNPHASASIVNEINQRAKSLQRLVDSQVGEGGIKTLVKDIEDGLKSYINDTKAWYQVTKQRAGELAPAGYQWNMNTMAIRELGESLVSRIYKENPRKTVMNMLTRIDELSNSRTFEDLIELRQLINNLRSRPNQGQTAYDAYQGIIDNIDTEIIDVSRQMGDEGAQWLADWESAKAAYSEMKTITESTLGKAFKREIVSDGTTKGAEQAARWLADFGTAENGMYQRLLKQLPLDVQPKVETLIIDRIITKNMFGDPTGKQAILFPKIARELADYNFIWPDAKALQSVVNDFAEIYQNDVLLAHVAGNVTKIDSAHFLTDDIARRAHFVFINKVWNQVRILLGGAKGDATALTEIAAKLLENPLNPKNVEEALKLAKGNEELAAAIRNFSADAAKAQHTGGIVTSKVKTYKDGSGKVWLQPGKGRTEIDSIPVHRMLDEEAALQVAKANDIENLSPAEKARLINAGFIAVGLDDGTVIKLL